MYVREEPPRKSARTSHSTYPSGLTEPLQLRQPKQNVPDVRNEDSFSQTKAVLSNRFTTYLKYV